MIYYYLNKCSSHIHPPTVNLSLFSKDGCQCMFRGILVKRIKAVLLEAALSMNDFNSIYGSVSDSTNIANKFFLAWNFNNLWAHGICADFRVDDLQMSLKLSASETIFSCNTMEMLAKGLVDCYSLIVSTNKSEDDIKYCFNQLFLPPIANIPVNAECYIQQKGYYNDPRRTMSASIIPKTCIKPKLLIAEFFKFFEIYRSNFGFMNAAKTSNGGLFHATPATPTRCQFVSAA